ncbi:hypothetical protein ACHAWO_000803 [Cyclotella atomus]|uniref:Uncharacterized protein n=1 Tax=Cyclotella atomus TaxID=382360 RepID=A0ABD3P252_9STRA
MHLTQHLSSVREMSLEYISSPASLPTRRNRKLQEELELEETMQVQPCIPCMLKELNSTDTSAS